MSSSCLLCHCRVNKFPPHQMLPLCQWICTRCPLVLVLMHWPQQYWTARDNSNLLKSKKKKVTSLCTRSLIFPAVYDDTQTIQTILFSYIFVKICYFAKRKALTNNNSACWKIMLGYCVWGSEAEQWFATVCMSLHVSYTRLIIAITQCITAPTAADKIPSILYPGYVNRPEIYILSCSFFF